jgi:glycosyltransferase involved in cell wall biosynthesis
MPEPIRWTPYLIERFWGGLAQTEILRKMSFGALAGPQLLQVIHSFINEGARCLDYGGGDGDFARVLIANRFRAGSYEPSRERSKIIEKAFADEPRFLGTINASSMESFDVLFCLEVIEHVHELHLADFLADLNKRLVKGGILILTCPNSEDLESQGVYCPVCDSKFHRWQHLRSIRPHTIRALFESMGFATLWQALIGFSDLAALERFREVGREDWPHQIIDEGGRSLPAVSPADRILYVGRKTRQVIKIPQSALQKFIRETQSRPKSIHEDSTQFGLPASLSVLQELLVEGRWPAGKLVGIEPNVSSSGVSISQVQHLSDMESLLSRASPTKLGVKTPVDAEAGTLLLMNSHKFTKVREDSRAVFAGSLDNYSDAVERGFIPEFSIAYVKDGPNWRTVQPLRRANTERADTAQLAYRSPTFGTLSQKLGLERGLATATLQSLGKKSWACAIQPALDRRENALVQELQNAYDFPYRLKRVVQGRIVLAISSLASGGAERQVIYAAEGLVQRGYDVHLLADYLRRDNCEFYLADAERAAASVSEISDTPNPLGEWTVRHPGIRRVCHRYLSNRVMNAAEYLKRISPELVHASLDWTNITVGLAAMLAGVPHIVISGRNLAPWHFSFFNWFMYPAYRALLRQPNVRLVTNSNAGARDYAAWLRISDPQIRVIRNGIDPSRFQPANQFGRLEGRRLLRVPADAKLVVSAFRFSEEKRPFTWLKAAAIIHREDPQTFFVVCGIGPLLDRAKQLASQSGIGERIVFAGTIQDIALVYAAADLVMLASAKEGCPNVLIEAQAMGIPVVATAAFGSIEAVEEGQTGLIVRAETARALASAALLVLGDEHFRNRAREAGPKFIQTRFGFARLVDDTLALYCSMGANNRNANPFALKS